LEEVKDGIRGGEGVKWREKALKLSPPVQGYLKRAPAETIFMLKLTRSSIDLLYSKLFRKFTPAVVV